MLATAPLLSSLPEPSAPLLYGFWALLVATSVAGLSLVRRFGAGRFGRALFVFALWSAAAGILAGTGVAGRWDLKPPPLMLMLLGGFVASILLARRPFGRALAENTPLWILIAFQAFRFPLELLLHRAYVDGLMPGQMSYAGRNFDIITGILAILVGAWAQRGPIPKAAAWSFNLIGFALLLNIVAIAIASTPLFAAFGPEALNTWVTQIPFVWLPMIFVVFAFFGHLLLTQRLLSEARQR